MNHPKGLTLDERGNIYIADTMNMAIRKISDTGISSNNQDSSIFDIRFCSSIQINICLPFDVTVWFKCLCTWSFYQC